MLDQNLTHLKSRTYGVCLRVYKGEEEEERKRLDYTINVNIIPTQPGRLYWYLSFTKSAIYYNRHEADLVSERLNTYISEAMYPIIVGVNPLNGVYEKMLKHDERIQRWEDKKKEIREKYESDTVELLFKRMDSQFENPRRFWQNLKREYFWSLFFQPLLHLKLGQKTEAVVELSLFPYELSKVVGNLSVDAAPTYYNTYLVHFTGSVEVSKAEYEQYFKDKIVADQVDIVVNIKWDIDQQARFIKHIKMEIAYVAKVDFAEYIVRRVAWTCFTTDQQIRVIEEPKFPTTWFGKLIDKILNI